MTSAESRNLVRLYWMRVTIFNLIALTIVMGLLGEWAIFLVMLALTFAYRVKANRLRLKFGNANEVTSGGQDS